MNFKTIILSFFLIFVCNLSYAQVSTYTFIDPCTKEVSVFSVPIQGGKTMMIFLDNVGYFDANDLSNGTFTNWVNLLTMITDEELVSIFELDTCTETGLDKMLTQLQLILIIQELYLNLDQIIKIH